MENLRSSILRSMPSVFQTGSNRCSLNKKDSVAKRLWNKLTCFPTWKYTVYNEEYIYTCFSNDHIELRLAQCFSNF